jgi:hypothetical protein
MAHGYRQRAHMVVVAMGDGDGIHPDRDPLIKG